MISPETSSSLQYSVNKHFSGRTVFQLNIHKSIKARASMHEQQDLLYTTCLTLFKHAIKKHVTQKHRYWIMQWTTIYSLFFFNSSYPISIYEYCTYSCAQKLFTNDLWAGKKKKAKSAMHVFFAITHSICIMSGKIVQRYLLIILCTLKERIICGPSKKKDNSALWSNLGHAFKYKVFRRISKHSHNSKIRFIVQTVLRFKLTHKC